MRYCGDRFVRSTGCSRTVVFTVPSAFLRCSTRGKKSPPGSSASPALNGRAKPASTYGLIADSDADAPGRWLKPDVPPPGLSHGDARAFPISSLKGMPRYASNPRAAGRYASRWPRCHFPHAPVA